MQAPLKDTLRKLKNRLQSKQRYCRCLQMRLRTRDAQIIKLRAERDALAARLAPRPLAHHHYPVQMIALAVFIVSQAGGSLRGAAKTVAYFARLMGWDYGAPSHATIDNWTRRLGLYCLEHEAAPVGRYAAIIDESIQIGAERCLLLLGVPLADTHCRLAPLDRSCVRVLGVQVGRSWKSAQVATFLRRCLGAEPHLQVAYVISDGGRNLLAALRSLELDTVSDCTHLLTRCLKRSLADHAPLSRLAAFLGTYRRDRLLGRFGHLAPPTLRDKDRFLRIFLILDWVDRLRSGWSALSTAEQQSLAYLNGAETLQLLEELRQLRRLVSLAAAILKTSGLNAAARRAWQQRLADYRASLTLCPLAEQLAAVVSDYFEQHAELIRKHKRLLCCSDIIESTFGTYKNKGGMQVISSDVLYLPLLGRTINADLVTKGLRTVSQPLVEQWNKQYTCDNRYRQLRRLRQRAKAATAVA